MTEIIFECDVIVVNICMMSTSLKRCKILTAVSKMFYKSVIYIADILYGLYGYNKIREIVRAGDYHNFCYRKCRMIEMKSVYRGNNDNETIRAFYELYMKVRGDEDEYELSNLDLPEAYKYGNIERIEEIEGSEMYENHKTEKIINACISEVYKSGNLAIIEYVNSRFEAIDKYPMSICKSAMLSKHKDTIDLVIKMYENITSNAYYLCCVSYVCYFKDIETFINLIRHLDRDHKHFSPICNMIGINGSVDLYNRFIKTFNIAEHLFANYTILAFALGYKNNELCKLIISRLKFKSIIEGMKDDSILTDSSIKNGNLDIVKSIFNEYGDCYEILYEGTCYAEFIGKDDARDVIFMIMVEKYENGIIIDYDCRKRTEECLDKRGIAYKKRIKS